MKIISANRSDVFNDYANIITNYNKKRILKDASAASSISTEALRPLVRVIPPEEAAKVVGDVIESAPAAARAAESAPAAARAAESAPAAAEATGGAAAAAATDAAQAATRAATEVTNQINNVQKEITKNLEDILNKLKDNNNVTNTTVTSISENLKKFTENLENLETQIKTALKNTHNDQVNNALIDLLKKVDELKPIINDAKATTSKISLSNIAGKISAVKKIKSLLITGLTIVGVGYGGKLIYDWYGESDESTEAAGLTGDGPSTQELTVQQSQENSLRPKPNNISKLKSLLMNPDKRKRIFDNLDLAVSKEKALESLAKAYDSIGFFELDTPVVVNNELIKYVFPSRRRGARLDSTRIEATKEYFSKVYSNPSKYGMLISRLQNESGSNDSQEIANYAFSTMAATGMFSGKGALFGDRGQRYGRGKDIKSKPEYGMSGGGKRRLTRQERRLSRQQAQEGSNLYDNISDPIEAFAAGKDEFFNKKINISTNKINNYDFAKKADETSNHYFKDAIQDLNDDEFMKAYYAGFSKMYNEKDKVQKPDYKNLYDLHDETGSELIHSAHPKAISVAEAIGDGGLVENVSESSKKMEEIAFRNPSGNYRARYAFIRNSLKKKS